MRKKKCNRCGVWIYDDTVTCPLCKSVLEEQLEDGGDKISGGYPKVEFDIDKHERLRNIFIFTLIMISGLLIFINYITYKGFMWSIIAVMVVAYIGVTVTYSIMNNANLAAKLVVQTVGAGILCIIVDNVTGYTGWSANYVIPGLILFADLSIVLCMIINRMNWQSYFMYQISITVISFIPILLYPLRLITRPMASLVTVSAAVIILAGTIIFGDKSIKDELIRRFNT